MAGIFRNTEGTREGKYLVQRRDGTVPEWPWFVLGGSDPIVPWVLRLYAVLALAFGYDRKYARDVWNLAGEFARWRRTHKTGDPDAPRHRTDNPEVIEKMRGGNGT